MKTCFIKYQHQYSYSESFSIEYVSRPYGSLNWSEDKTGEEFVSTVDYQSSIMIRYLFILFIYTLFMKSSIKL